MKKILYILAVAAMTAMACTKEARITDMNEKSGDKKLVKMSFSVSSDIEKAFINPDRSVSFKAGDKISIFANGTNYEFTTDEGGADATFTGTAEEASVFYALYPYTSGATIDGNTIKGISIQQGSQGTGTGGFNSKQVVFVASTTGTHLYFRQVCALLKITVPAGVTDLKEIVGFNRDNGSSNTAGAISGTFDVTLGENDAPTVSVTTPKFQIGIVGPNGSSKAMPAGVYYIPVLPAQLTTKKGIDLKLSFLDGKTARAFNGNGLKLKSGKVYDMGTVKKTDIFVENGFETGNISYFVTDNKDAQGNKAISIVKNPYQTDINPSDSVLCDNMYTKTNNTSGFFEVQTGNEAGYIRFPSSVRGFYGTLRIKMYLGTNAYYPRVKRGSNSPALPKYLNGVEVTSQEVWDANVKTDDWNILEYIPSMIDSGWTDFANLATYQIRPFVNYSGGNTEGFDETTNNRLIWIDDITFVLK